MILINALQRYCLAGLFMCSGFKLIGSPVENEPKRESRLVGFFLNPQIFQDVFSF